MRLQLKLASREMLRKSVTDYSFKPLLKKFALFIYDIYYLYYSLFHHTLISHFIQSLFSYQKVVRFRSTVAQPSSTSARAATQPSVSTKASEENQRLVLPQNRKRPVLRRHPQQKLKMGHQSVREFLQRLLVVRHPQKLLQLPEGHPRNQNNACRLHLRKHL